jgi:predicted transcriptional regulator
MGENKKPILSVLVDEDKKTKFSNLAREHNYSMGWLLNQAIDKMLEAGTIHIYRDSVLPIDAVAVKSLPTTDIEEVIRSYVDKALSPVNDDLVTLQAQLANIQGASLTDLTHWDELKAEVGYLRNCIENGASKDYVEKALLSVHVAIDAIAKASVTTTTTKTHNPQQSTTTATPEKTQNGVTPLIARVVTRLQADPNLKARVAEGCRQGLKGKDLSDWLASGGFLNSNNDPYTGASLSQFRAAIECLNSINNGAKTDG